VSCCVLAVCQEVLAGPAVAAQAAAGASHKNRKAAEELLTRAVADALHLLGMLKEVLPLLGGAHTFVSLCIGAK
jgi:ribosomal RNA-processing protein 12